MGTRNQRQPDQFKPRRSLRCSGDANRSADTGSIATATYGAIICKMSKRTAGPIDLLLWGAPSNGILGSAHATCCGTRGRVGWQPVGLGLNPGFASAITTRQ